MMLLALRPSPAAEAFLLRIFTDPDEAIRPGDQGVYPAADLRVETGPRPGQGRLAPSAAGAGKSLHAIVDSAGRSVGH